MEHQDHRESVQFGRAGDSFIIDGEQVAVPRPLVVILRSISLGLA